MNTDTLYVIETPNGDRHFARTPDGVCVYWYRDRLVAEGDISPAKMTLYFSSVDDFEKFLG